MDDPTAPAIKMKFPEFSSETDTAIEFAIEEAKRMVDIDTWLPGDYQLGIMYLAAHYLMVSISRRESASGQQIQSERIGEISVTYKSPEQPSATKSDDFITTPYGTRFLQLLHLNFPPIAVV